METLHTISLFPKPFLQNKKPAFVLYISFVLFALLIGVISFFPVYSDVFFPLIKASQLFAFIVMGIIYLWISYKYIFTSSLKNMGEVWPFTLLLTLLIGIALSILYIITRKPTIMAFGSSSAFLLPFVVAQVWHIYSIVVEEEEKLQTIKDAEKIRVQKIADELEKEQKEIKSRQESQEMKLLLEEMRRKRKEADEKRVIQEQEQTMKKEQMSYENKLKEEIDLFRLKQGAIFENELSQELEIRSRKNEEAFNNNLKKAQMEIKQKEKEIYEKKLQNHIKEIKRRKVDFFEKNLEEDRDDLVS